MITSIFLSFAKFIASKDSVPQSTVKIIFTPFLINFQKAFLFEGPKPSDSSIWNVYFIFDF